MNLTNEMIGNNPYHRRRLQSLADRFDHQFQSHSCRKTHCLLKRSRTLLGHIHEFGCGSAIRTGCESKLFSYNALGRAL